MERGLSRLTSLLMRVATWNLERKKPTTPRGAEALDYLESVGAEIIVATEARTSFGFAGGQSLLSAPPRGSRFAEDERKVVLWSSSEIERIDIDSPIDPTRFVAGRVHTTIGPIIVFSICITWHMAGVRYDPGPKRKPWEEHLTYLQHLTPIIRSLDEPFVLAGDFNQRIPRVKGGNKAAAEALDATFDGIDIVTRGVLPGCTRPGIDHIALSSHLRATNVAGWANDVTGNRLSDHDGAFADVELSSGVGSLR